MAGTLSREHPRSAASCPSDTAKSDQQQNPLASFSMENMAATVVLTDANGVIQYINPFCTSALGYRPAEMEGAALSTFWIEPSAPWPDITAELERNGSWQGKIEHRTKDGGKQWEMVSISAVKDHHGAITHLVKTGQPIEASKLKVVEPSDLERTYRQLLENSADGYFEVDLNGNFTYVNEALCLFGGRSQEEMLGLNYRDHMKPEEAKRIYDFYHQVYSTGIPSQLLEYEIIKKDGSTAVNQTFVVPRFNTAEEAIGFCGVVRDLTDLKRAEMALKASEQKHRRILANLEEGYYETDLEGNLTGFNDATCSNIGGTKSEVMGMNYREFTTPESAQIISERLNQINKTGQPAHIVACEFIRKDGTRHFHEISVSQMKDETGQAIGFFGISRDRTVEMELERALQESEESYRHVLELAPDAICITDASSLKYVQVNEAFCQHLSLTPKEIIGRTPIELNIYQNPEDDRKVQKLLARDGKIDGLEIRFQGKDGRILDDLVSARMIQFRGRPCALFVATVITPLKKAQASLKESEESYRRVMALAPDAITISRISDGRYFEVNEAFCEQTGYTREEAIGRSVLDLNIYANPEDRNRVVDELRQHGHVDKMKIHFRAKDGTELIDLFSARIIQFKGEECFLAVATVINPLIETQQALAESEESYRRIMELAPSTIAITRVSDSRIMAVNNAFCRQTGYSSEEAVGRTPIELGLYTDPENRKRWTEMLRWEGKVQNLELQFRTRDGSIQDDLFSAQFIRFKGEECILTVIHRITTLKQSQRALKEKEESQRAILDTAPYAITIVSQSDLRYLQVNHSFCSNTGYRLEEVIGHTSHELNVFADENDRERMKEKLLSEGSIDGMEMRIRKKDGTIMQTLLSCRPMKFEGQRALLFISADISALKNAQRALRDSEESYRNVIESAPNSMAIIRRSDNCYIEVNKTFCRQTGCKREELVGRTVQEMNFYKNRSDLARVTKSLSSYGRVESMEIRFRTRDGRTLQSLLSVTPIRYMGEECLLSSNVDITAMKMAQQELDRYRQNLEQMVADRTRELETAQQELVQQERLAALGQLTATVSHELRNPLGVIRSSNFYLRRKTKDQDEKQAKHFRRIEEQVALCDTIVSDLLEYTRGRSVSTVRQQLAEWVPEVVEQMQESEGMDVTLALADDLPPLPHDREKMRRVIINLLDNAVQAVKARAKEEGLDYRPFVSVKAVKEDETVAIRVVDNGIGMDEQTCRQAFEPLFTTRARGTGIGLANVKKIVDEHGGEIALNSRPQRGTEMKIVLPCRSRTTGAF